MLTPLVPFFYSNDRPGWSELQSIKVLVEMDGMDSTMFNTSVQARSHTVAKMSSQHTRYNMLK